MPPLAPAAGGMQLQFASAGGGGGGRDDDYPDDEFYDDEPPEDDEPAPRRERRPARRATAARQRTVQTDPDDRYWTDYLRIALPVIGLLLVIAVFWYWAQQLIDSDSEDLSPTAPGLAEIVDTPAEATEAPATPTPPAGNILQPQSGGTPTNPLQAIPSPTPAGEQPAAQDQQAAETETPTEEAAAGTGEIAPDTQVSVIEGPLNMRAEATTTSDIVVTLDTGALLTVLSGPEEGEGYVWWQVTDEAGNTGWVVQEFVQPAA
jgi:hypothetical protein